ncbi:Hsp20/alpha crystallin family protein [Tepidimonas taiwanensis]|uniref:18 kDa heat shock protein n=1 Tax=Tepidimonas taiwanensis TaxID=307486 RepID=A0A554XAE8_9BURK|nr:Hsp20/alpha crystallin family protein [Tepidimonas taiwanensis]MCX7692858.1 Hsp20/alpha crystallin family protein [Tepidimonas taiwanensis]TSE32814.1 18 kDa heat shock protein [Tepidimonas taiwanensis]UBQ05636.1 Hsp20/alpha crystallin family protein [Tepidimonas taiwanensis]
MSNLIPRRMSLFDEFFRDLAPGFYIRPLHGEPLPQQIKLDVSESDNAYTIAAELPGVNKDAIHVTVENNVVTISAEVKQEDTKRDGDKVLHSERYFGAVSRTLALPGDVDEAQASAKFENGVLTLTLPKKVAVAGKRIRIE